MSGKASGPRFLFGSRAVQHPAISTRLTGNKDGRIAQMMTNMMQMTPNMMANMMPNMMPMMANMMPMMAGMMPMPMCKMTCEMTPRGMVCTMMPMEGMTMDTMKECCERMNTMMTCGMPMMMMCGGMPMMLCMPEMKMAAAA